MSKNNLSVLVKKNRKPLLAILLVLLTLSVLYILIENRNTNVEGFQDELPYHQGPVNWNKDTDVLVVFSKMEGCGHCVRLVPEWKKASDKVNGETMPNGKTCRMVVVDPSHELSEGVRGFPTVKKYVGDNDGVEFNDERTSENLIKFCMSS